MEPAVPANFVVVRSTGHSGSRWLAELLSTQNLSFFFEFSGRCPERYPLANASLKALFELGCDCRLDDAMDPVCPPDAGGHIRSATCSKDALCSGRCPRRGPGSCLAVGLVDTYSEPLARRLQQHRSTGESVAVVTFERDNSVKHAVSKLKAACAGTRLKVNHVARRPPPPSAPPPSLIHVEPELLAAEALDAARGRRLMRAGLSAILGEVRVALHYEELQRDAAAALRATLGALGVATGFDAAALERSLLVKGAAEDLSRALLNFAELEAAFANVTCLRAMLASGGPRRFEPSCGAAREAALGAHYAKQPVAAQTLSCEHRPHHPAPDAAAAPDAATPLEEDAPRTDATRPPPARRARPPLPRGTTACERRGGGFHEADEHGSHDRRQQKRAGNGAAAPACTPAEVRLCEQAAAHGYGLTGTLDAELCVLRRPGRAPDVLPVLSESVR
eukprot:Transcript_13539.p1 GENE.Transcript_13539~~Transcript_13539.p1  ORF type:complete len:456 (-),score=151.91 Transcript_13539:184-1530(-)